MGPTRVRGDMVDDAPFETPDDAGERWVDVRMTDPDEGEWDIDLVVADGRVEYVDLRVRPGLLTAFLDCLVDDVGEERAREVLAGVAERRGIDLDFEG